MWVKIEKGRWQRTDKLVELNIYVESNKLNPESSILSYAVCALFPASGSFEILEHGKTKGYDACYRKLDEYAENLNREIEDEGYFHKEMHCLQ